MSTPHHSESSPLWSERWHGLMTELGYDMTRGRMQARRGRVTAVEVQVGRVTATVQDRETGSQADQPQVEVSVNTYNDETWNRVLDSLGDQALFAAQLLAGDLPQTIDDHFQKEGVHLLPADRNDIDVNCSACAKTSQACRHASGLLFVLGQMLDEDPWLLFRLRGRDRQQVLQAMRRRRSEGEEGSPGPGEQRRVSAPRFAPMQENEHAAMPLTTEMDNYWGKSKQLADLHHHISPPTIRLALLRRLGHPPFPTDSLDTYDRLASLYDEVSQAALDLAYAPEPEEESAG